MIEELATVTALDEGHAWVQTQRQSACKSCSAQKGCGTSAVGKVIGQQYTQVRVLNSAQATIGDLVKVGLPEDMLLKSSMAVYIVPLFLMIVGGVTADTFSVENTIGQWFAVLGALTGLALGAVWLKLYAVKMSSDERFQPIVIQVIQAAPQPSNINITL